MKGNIYKLTTFLHIVPTLVYQMDKKMPLVQETRFWCTNKDKTSVSGQWKETVGEQEVSFLIYIHPP